MAGGEFLDFVSVDNDLLPVIDDCWNGERSGRKLTRMRIGHATSHCYYVVMHLSPDFILLSSDLKIYYLLRHCSSTTTNLGEAGTTGEKQWIAGHWQLAWYLEQSLPATTFGS